MTRVRDLMSPDVQVVAETDSLTAAARLVRAHDVGSLPVCEPGRPARRRPEPGGPRPARRRGARRRRTAASSSARSPSREGATMTPDTPPSPAS